MAGGASIWRSLCKQGFQSVVVGFLLVGALAQAKGPVEGLGSVALLVLPPEAQQTQRLILAGGPFPSAKDGAVFGNFERVLPRRERGFYREYTVPTPGSRDRGARRIVCGGNQPTHPDACFYTADHYASFKHIAH
jgi:ribonuclease T1